MYSMILLSLMSTTPHAPDFGGRLFGRAGCTGCAGCAGSCMGCYGSNYPPAMAMPYAPVPMLEFPDAQPAIPTIPQRPPAALGETLEPPTALGESVTTLDRATVVVTLPADARLFADGQPIEGTGTVRTFRTPVLEQDKLHYYIVSMEVQRGGRTVRNDERVLLQTGKVARVDFPEPGADTPAPPLNAARIRVRLPAGAALAVEGQAWPTRDAKAVVTTPPLESGKTHFYALTIEVVRDGRRSTLTREVAFRAGDSLTVDLGESAVNVARR